MNLRQLINLTARQITNSLEKDGFFIANTSGSHRTYKHPDNRRVVIPYHHSGQTYSFKKIKDIIECTGWTEADLKRLELIK
jgi:predicted RNA binding protein YcfA (HicA-like mRNA interferase family)